MKAYRLTAASQEKKIWKQVEEKRPEPDHGQVLVKVHATSINYRDLMIIDGTYPTPAKEVIALSDGAGEIIALGEGVQGWKNGDRVCGAFYPDWKNGVLNSENALRSLGGSDDGMLAQYAVLNQDAIVRIPSHLSYEEAATLPCAAVTAWNALMVSGQRLLPGATVLVQGTGGVSIFAAQFALAAGLRVIALSSSSEKIRRLHALGIKDTVNYKEHPQWQEKVLEFTDGKGVDHVVEVGGSGTLPQSMQAARHSGDITIIGVLTGTVGSINPLPILGKNLRVHGIRVGSVQMLEDMGKSIETTKLKPAISKIFPFSEAPKALEELRSGSHFGKLVVRME